MSTDQLAELCNEHREQMVGFALKVLGDRQDAEDVVQDVFERALRQGYLNYPRAWLYKVLRHRIVDAVRSRNRRDRHVVTFDVTELAETLPAPNTGDEEIGGGAMDLLAPFPPAHRTCMLLVADGFSMNEIATALGLHVSKVKRYVMVVRRRLRSRPEPATAVDWQGALEVLRDWVATNRGEFLGMARPDPGRTYLGVFREPSFVGVRDDLVHEVLTAAGMDPPAAITALVTHGVMEKRQLSVARGTMTAYVFPWRVWTESRMASAV